MSTLVGLYRPLLPDYSLAHLLDYEVLEYRLCPVCEIGFFIPPVEGTPEFYAALSVHSWYYQTQKPEFDIARRFIGNGDRVLDIGCGSGEFSTLIPCARYTGIDTNTRAVAQALACGRPVHHGSLNSLVGDCEHSFDVVCCFQVLEHMANPRELLQQADARLRNGGILIVSVPNSNGFLGFECNEPLNFPPHHLTWWTVNTLRHMAREFNYEVLTIEHDPVTATFARRYATELILAEIRARLGTKRRMVGQTLMNRVLRRGAAFAGRFIAGAVQTGRIKGRFEGHGHSVTAVLKKARSHD